MAKAAERVEQTEHSTHGIRWLSDEEARSLFDAKAQRIMGMSGDGFLRRYDAGEFDDMPDDIEHLDYWNLVLSIPFGR